MTSEKGFDQYIKSDKMAYNIYAERKSSSNQTNVEII